MQRLNLAWWSWVSKAISAVESIEPDTPFKQGYPILRDALNYIVVNHAPSALVKLKVSDSAANKLFEAVHAVIKDESRADPVSPAESASMKSAANEYRRILEAELQYVDAYFVRPKGLMETERLIERADEVWGVEVATRLPAETREDLRQSGRCLAFVCPTAAGFHVARATETMILALMDSAGCPKPGPGDKNWGAYVRALGATNVDKKIIHHIEQVKDLHRNPLIHPEVTLTMVEAQQLWGVCTGLIGALMAERDRLQPPAPPVTATSS